MLYSEMFPLGKDNTDYKKIDGDFFSIVGLPLIHLLNVINKIGKK